MLQTLAIRDVVLIDRLDLAFRPGLCVLTGETGAGKSILLDALGLALGQRAEAALVRAGVEEAAVTAGFAVGGGHPAHAILREAGLDADGEEAIQLRRLVRADGRSRAYVNDAPVSIGLLRRLGDSLVEIQGQFESRGLLDPTTHRELLDAYAGDSLDLAGFARTWQAWQAAERRAAEAAAHLAMSRDEEELWRHQLAEFDALRPQADEEERLAERRTLLQHAERLAETLAAAVGELDGEGGARAVLARAARRLERGGERAPALFEVPLAAIARAAAETEDALAALAGAARAIDLDPQALEAVEERLFALKGLARKHHVGVADLPALHAELAARLAALDTDAEEATGRACDAAAARTQFLDAAGAASAVRAAAARRLDAAVAAELAPLRLGQARFRTVLTPEDEVQWGEHGVERVHFEIAANPGSPFGPLARVASGGELSRLMLALRLVLAGGSPAPTLIFDEVDSGIGGAVAAAVGERLQRLGTRLQVLVVTHSPQVAARGAWHWRVAKLSSARHTVTRVEELDRDTRQEEIARMLSGHTVTAEARAAAASLIAAGLAIGAPA
jgi:DNA repair protein RecN (Recombination protein N)